MSLDESDEETLGEGFPRSRGDEPWDYIVMCGTIPFSPLTRG